MGVLGSVLQIARAPEGPDGRSILKPTRWTGRTALDRALRDVDTVADVLTQWLNSP